MEEIQYCAFANDTDNKQENPFPQFHGNSIFPTMNSEAFL